MTGLLSIDDAARYLSVSKDSLRRWTRQGTLACMRVGARRERRFQLEDLDRMLGPNTPLQDQPAVAALPTEPLGILDAAALKGVQRHVCLHFRDRDELWELFRPYVLDHAQQKRAIVYIHEETSRADVLARLRGEGLDPKRMVAGGLLRLLVPSQAYLRTGSFEPARMIDFVEGAILDRRGAGHEAMLVSGEMIWRLSGAPGVERMDEYEMRLNHLLLRYPKVTIVCHYDMHRLSSAMALGALCTHPHVQLPTGMLPGYFARAQAPA